MNIGHADFDLNWLLFAQPDRHGFLHFDLFEFEDFPNDGFLDNPLNLSDDLLPIPFGHDYHFLFVWDWHFLDDRDFMPDGDLNELLLILLRNHDLFNGFDDVDWLLDCVCDCNGDLLFYLHQLRNLHKVVNDLLQLDVFRYLHRYLFGYSHLLDICDIPKHLH